MTGFWWEPPRKTEPHPPLSLGHFVRILLCLNHWIAMGTSPKRLGPSAGCNIDSKRPPEGPIRPDYGRERDREIPM